jgi:hypothetical protein
MASAASLFTVLSIPLLLTNLVNALPIPQQTALISPARPVACEPLSTYTTEWFLANTLPSYRAELHSKALFYTRGASHNARELAKANPKQYTTIWEVWPCNLYDDRQIGSNPLRCIHEDHDKRTVFYENMSRAFARMARDSATVMHLNGDYEREPDNGIWARVELPTLRQATDVETVRSLCISYCTPLISVTALEDRPECQEEHVVRTTPSRKDVGRDRRSRARSHGRGSCHLSARKEDVESTVC